MLCAAMILPLGALSQEVFIRAGEIPKSLPAQARKELARIGQDSAETYQVLQTIVDTWQEAGHMEAGIDNFLWHEGDFSASLHLGPQYWLDSLVVAGLPPAWGERSRLSSYARKRRLLHWPEVEQRLQTSLKIAQNEGFPFASISQRTLEYADDSLHRYAKTSYRFETGPEIRIDSIRFTGKKKEPDSFVWGILQLRPGDLFDQSQVEAIPTLLNNTVYYESSKPPLVAYTDQGKALITVDLKQRKSNQFDVLAGLLPAPPNSGDRFQFTVTADITLVSPLGMGEIIGLEFQKLPGTSQLVDIFTRLPYLFRTPFQVEGGLKLQKQEELFQNLTYEAGLLYHFSPYFQAKISYQGIDSRLLEEAVKDTAKLVPDQLDGTRRLVGVGFSYLKLDYRNNPRQGLESSLTLLLGRREVRENVLLREIRPEWYTSVPAEQGLQEAEFRFRYFVPLGKRQVIHLGNYSYWLGMEKYLRNDQRQIGGVYSLRGFNENQYFADLFTISTLEYRLQLERDSYLFGFLDLALLRDKVSDINRRAFGSGIGMQYGTKAGLLSIVYGIGVSEDQSFQPSRGRIHLGLLNQF